MNPPKLFYIIVIAACAVIVTGCESDEKKLERLQTEEVVSASQLDSTRATAVRASYTNSVARETTDVGIGFHPSKPYLDSLHTLARIAEDRFHAANIRHQLAQRELAKFMSGR